MEQVVSACKTLFGSPFFVSQSIVDWLTTQDIGIAFQRTIEKHIPPGIDILKDGGKLHAPTIRTFIRAYQILTDFVEQRQAEGRSASVVLNHCHGQRRLKAPKGTRAEQDMVFSGGRIQYGSELYYDGQMLPTKLRFGAYLYYRGLISYEMLTDALEWQKKHRPLMGQIAMKAGLMTPADFAQILLYLRIGESFGQVAREHNKLTAAHVNKIIELQERTNTKIGNYFVEAGIL